MLKISKRHSAVLLLLVSVGLLASTFHFHGIAFEETVAISEVESHGIVKAYDECNLCADSIEAEEANTQIELNLGITIEEIEIYSPEFNFDSYRRSALGRAPPSQV